MVKVKMEGKGQSCMWVGLTAAPLCSQLPEGAQGGGEDAQVSPALSMPATVQPVHT